MSPHHDVPHLLYWFSGQHQGESPHTSDVNAVLGDWTFGKCNPPKQLLKGGLSCRHWCAAVCQRQVQTEPGQAGQLQVLQQLLPVPLSSAHRYTPPPAPCFHAFPIPAILDLHPQLSNSSILKHPGAPLSPHLSADDLFLCKSESADQLLQIHLGFHGIMLSSARTEISMDGLEGECETVRKEG
jgi:hypothetical protein